MHSADNPQAAPQHRKGKKASQPRVPAEEMRKPQGLRFRGPRFERLRTQRNTKSSTRGATLRVRNPASLPSSGGNTYSTRSPRPKRIFFYLLGQSRQPATGTPEAPRRNYKSHEALGRGEVMTKPPRIGHAGRGAQAFSEGRGGARGGASGGASAGTPPRPRPPPRLDPPLLSLPGQRAGVRRWRRRTIICSSCC